MASKALATGRLLTLSPDQGDEVCVNRTDKEGADFPQQI